MTSRAMAEDSWGNTEEAPSQPGGLILEDFLEEVIGEQTLTGLSKPGEYADREGCGVGGH